MRTYLVLATCLAFAGCGRQQEEHREVMSKLESIQSEVANHDSSRPVTLPSPPAEPEREFDGILTLRVTVGPSGDSVAGALVKPRMFVDDISVAAPDFLTSTAGVGVVRYPLDLTKQIWVAVEKEGLASQQASVALFSRPTNHLEIEMTLPPRVTGVARDSAGERLAGVELTLWPAWRASTKGATTDADGKFVLAWNCSNQNILDNELILVARDLKRNLALAQLIDEETTNLDLRLAPGLTLTARATDAKGNAITNAQVELIFQGERAVDALGESVLANAGGRFEIKALPAGRRYDLTISAKGYGSVTRTVNQQPASGRVELEPFMLPLADRCIAGVAIDASEKPVASVSIQAYGEGQPSVNGYTGANGRFSLSGVCAGPIVIYANCPDSGFCIFTAEGGHTNIAARLMIREGVSGAFNISGRVTDPDGKPAAKALVSVFPSASGDEKETDSEGRFTVRYDPDPFSMGLIPRPVLVARDPTRNLATALEPEEGLLMSDWRQHYAAKPTLRLQPALALAGRVTNPNGEAITNAQAQFFFHTQPGESDSKMGLPAPVDAGGRFEIKGLPQGRQYSVNTSAKGYGQASRIVADSDTQTKRVQLEPCRLLPADQRIAGVVLDDSGKPAAYAAIESHGRTQPTCFGSTDANGHFSIGNVCAGPIGLRIFPRGLESGYAIAEGGDSNILIHTTPLPVPPSEEPSLAGLNGKPLPDLALLGLTPADTPANKAVLAVLIDARQRPSRRTLRLLKQQAAAFQQKGVCVIQVLLHRGRPETLLGRRPPRDARYPGREDRSGHLLRHLLAAALHRISGTRRYGHGPFLP